LDAAIIDNLGDVHSRALGLRDFDRAKLHLGWAIRLGSSSGTEFRDDWFAYGASAGVRGEWFFWH
jgi:hypothetical protein